MARHVRSDEDRVLDCDFTCQGIKLNNCGFIEFEIDRNAYDSGKPYLKWNRVVYFVSDKFHSYGTDNKFNNRPLQWSHPASAVKRANWSHFPALSNEGSKKNTMTNSYKIWIEQCEASLSIREDFGIQKALGYLIGEKLLNFVRTSDVDPKFAEELPRFIEEIKAMYQPWEIRDYLENIRRVGVFGHIGSDEEVERMRAGGMIEEDIVHSAEDVLLMDRIKALLCD
jgi:hypothetical protein